MSKSDKDTQISTFFTQHLERFGPESARSVVWNSKESQQARYDVLAEVADLHGASLLDVGSGLGDLYGYLQPYGVSYEGVELSESMAQASRRKYPGISVKAGNFLDLDFSERYDYVVCSGSLNIRYENHAGYLQSAIRKMWELCTRGVAFNLPSNQCSELLFPRRIEEADGIEIAYVSPPDILELCLKLSSKVNLRHDYLPHDFTVFMYR